MKKSTKLGKMIRKNNTLPGGIVSGFVSLTTMRKHAKLGHVKFNGRWVLTVAGYKEI